MQVNVTGAWLSMSHVSGCVKQHYKLPEVPEREGDGWASMHIEYFHTDMDRSFAGIYSLESTLEIHGFGLEFRTDFFLLAAKFLPL